MANYDGKIRSLCISYDGWYYRVADYIDSFGRFQSINYKEGKIRNRLYLNPKEKIYEHKPVLKEWYDNGDSTNVLPGIKNIGKIYEIISIFENDYNGRITYDENRIVEKLYDGFYIPSTVDDEFLLYIGMKEESLTTILVKRKYLKKDKTKDNIYYLDINENNKIKKINYLSIYKISKDEIISTKNLTGSFEVKALIGDDRYFYESMELPQECGKLLIREFDNIITEFISRYIEQKQNILSITDNEKNKLIELLNRYTNDEQEIKELIKLMDLSDEQIKKRINLLLQPILKVYSGQDEINNLVEDYLLKDNRIYERCIKIVKEDWNISKDEEKKEKEKEINDLYQIISLNEEKNKDIEYKIEDNKKKFEELSKEINDLEDKKINIELEIEDQLIDFKSNIVETTKLLGVAESYNTDNFRKKESKDKSLLYIESEKLEESDIYRREEYEDLEDVYYSLSENLEENLSKSEDIAISIITSILMKKFIVVDEYLGRKIADDLAMIISSSTADYISITNVDIDVELLIKFINDSKSSVVYIDGLLDTFNSNLVSTIYKNCNNKRIILGFLEENLIELPKSIWNYSIYIDYSEKIIFRRDDEKIIGNYDKLFDIEKSGIFEECELKKLFEEEDTCRRLYKRKYINRRNNLDMSLYANLSREIGEIISLDFLNNIYLQASDVNRAKLVGDLVKFGFSEEEILKSLFANEE